MAREFAQIKLSIWADDDWRDLSPDARYLYLTLLTSPTLTHCGTADWRPTRIGALNGQGVETVNDAGMEMVESLHLVIDEETEEVLIRSFIRNDGLMKQPRMAVSMANAHAAVASRSIRGVLVHELIRLRRDFPELSGWEKEAATKILSLEPIDPSDFPLGKGPFGGPFGGGFTPGLGETQRSVSGSVKGSPTPSPATATTDSRRTTATSDSDESDTSLSFEAFWDAYANKVGRKKSETAYRAALKKRGVTAELLIRSATEYAAWCIETGTYQKNPTSWLHGEHWNDERAARREPPTRSDEHLALVRKLAADERDAQVLPLREIEGGRA